MDRKLYNCPNCSAPIGYSDVCAYCGTRLNWIPFKFDVQIVPHYIKPTTVEVSTFVGDELPIAYRDKYATEGMVDKLTRHVLCNVQIRKERDWRKCGTIYKARLMFADLNDGMGVQE